MDPFVIYISVMALALVMCVIASTVIHKPSRACLACGEETPIEGRRCRHCGYEFRRV